MDCFNFYSEKQCFSELFDSTDGEEMEEERMVKDAEDLEMNPFDRLPLSSHYYKLLKEKEGLPVWQVKNEFLESLHHHQIVIVSGDIKTGESSQEIGKAYQIIQEEGANLNPDLRELVPVPFYPSERERMRKPNGEKTCKNHERKVLLTTSIKESLVWIRTVAFVIDIGIEKRKVNKLAEVNKLLEKI